MTYREAALRKMLAWVGKTEQGFNNRGKFVEWIQRLDSLKGEGYPWCQATVNAAFVLSGYGPIANGSASVGFAVAWAQKKHYIVHRPKRADVVAFHFDDNTWADHTGMVVRVLSLGPIVGIATVEGNTSPDEGGSQDDGGGVWKRRRFYQRSKLVFYRVPGEAT